MTRTIAPILLRAAFALVAAALCAGAAGCNIVAPVLYLAHGPAKTPRLYELDAKKPMVVFIDDRAGVVPRRVLRIKIADEVEKQLLDRRAATDMINSQSALAAVGQERQGKPIPIAEIGRAVKADLVIYATVDSFTLSLDGQSFNPSARVRVKVVDAADDKRLWPADARGHPVDVQMRVRAAEMPTSTSARHKAEDELAVETGLEIARLFFTHESPRAIKGPN